MVESDFAAAVDLQRLCFPDPFPEEYLWQEQHLAAHLQNFPEGQWVALFEGQVVGSCSNARISVEVWEKHGTWAETLGDCALSGHDPGGLILHGADISVNPSFRNMGVGRSLYSTRFNYVKDKNLYKYATGCRVPDFRNWFGAGKPSESDFSRYVGLVRDSVLTDRTLSPLLRMGCTPIGVHANYMEDSESANGAVLLEWNP